MDPDRRQVRNIMMSWSEVKRTVNPLFDQGYRFLCLTPKSRHSVHSSWAVTDWHWIWNSNFGDPYRADKRMPGVGDAQLHMNPVDARSLGLEDGDWVWIDANPADRPYVGASEDDPFYEAARLMARVSYNPGYPSGVTMIKHAFYMATPRTVEAQKTRSDGRALAETGYQASFRHGSQQSLTRGWAPPMHQTDTLFHKRAAGMGFLFGFDVDNHAINTVPKETVVRITRSESGGMGSDDVWSGATTGKSPGGEDRFMQRYLGGQIVTIKGRAT